MTDCQTTTRSTVADDTKGQAIRWLEDQFPGWSIDVDTSSGWQGDLRPLWVARREGHHPQAEFSAAKLHTRLAEYLEREARRRALSN